MSGWSLLPKATAIGSEYVEGSCKRTLSWPSEVLTEPSRGSGVAAPPVRGFPANQIPTFRFRALLNKEALDVKLMLAAS